MGSHRPPSSSPPAANGAAGEEGGRLWKLHGVPGAEVGLKLHCACSALIFAESPYHPSFACSVPFLVKGNCTITLAIKGAL